MCLVQAQIVPGICKFFYEESNNKIMPKHDFLMATEMAIDAVLVFVGADVLQHLCQNFGPRRFCIVKVGQADLIFTGLQARACCCMS